MKEKNHYFSAYAVILFCTIIAYWNVQYNQLISYDDVKYLIENEMVRSGFNLASVNWALTAVYDANWFPLTWIVHMVDVSLFGMDARGHHFVNIALHAVNSMLLYCLLSRLTGNHLSSLVVSLIFAVHPLHVESVAWAAELKDVLSTFFFVLTIHAYLGFLASRTVIKYLLMSFLFVCGLMSKPMIVTLPLLLLTLDYWPLQRLSLASLNEFKPFLIEKLPLFLIAAISSYITLAVQRAGGAVSDTAATPFTNVVSHIFHNYQGYVLKLLWPTGLSAIYPYRESLSQLEVMSAIVIIFVITIVVFRYCRLYPFLLFGWLWFVIALIPVSGIVAVGAHSIADRYTYIPSIGFAVIVVWLWRGFVARREKYSFIIIAFVIVSLTILTWKQVGYWKDSTTLFEHSLAVTENNWVAHANLAAELLKYNRHEEAVYHMREAVRINPDDFASNYNFAMTLNMLGNRQGAIEAIHRAIALKPRFGNAYFYAALFHAQSGNMSEAKRLQEKLATIDTELAVSLAASLRSMESVK